MKPEDVVTVFTRYFLEKDLKGIVSLYDKNAVYYFPPNDIRAIGREKIADVWRRWFQRYTPLKFHLKLQNVRYDPHNRRYATVRSKGYSIVNDSVQNVLSARNYIRWISSGGGMMGNGCTSSISVEVRQQDRMTR
jgi:SnoaL-like domain